MKAWLISATSLACALAAPAIAQAPGAQDPVRTASAPTGSAAGLALTLSQSVDRARSQAEAARAGSAGIEAEVAGVLEDEIIQSAADPLLVQEALRLTLEAQRCTLTDREAGLWSRTGCASIADLLSTVTTALGGPAAAGPTGGIPGVAGGAPPVSAAGSDYAQD